jgi:hypothetical protein
MAGDRADALRVRGGWGLPRALRTASWFGVEAARRATGPRFDPTLRGLLPPEMIAQLRSPERKGTARPGPSGAGEQK